MRLGAVSSSLCLFVFLAWTPGFFSRNPEILSLERTKAKVLESFSSAAGHDGFRDQIVQVSTSQKNSPSGYISATLSRSGIEYAKQVVVQQVLEEIIPLQVPDLSIATSTMAGTVAVNVTDVVLWNATVPDAHVSLSPDDITLFAGSAAANMTLRWQYSYAGIVGDRGSASVQVSGLQVAGIFNITELDGALTVGVIQAGAVIDALSIRINSTYSWMYNWLIESFRNHLRVAVESSVVSAVGMAVDKLNVYMQALPRQLSIDSAASINATLPCNPTLNPAYLFLQCDGRFVPTSRAIDASSTASYSGAVSSAKPSGHDTQRNGSGDEAKQEGEDGREEVPTHRGGGPQDQQEKVEERMVKMVVSQEVIDSAAVTYFEAGYISYEVDHLPDSFPLHLNTGSWRFILPKLYAQYPDTPITLEILASQAPAISLLQGQGFSATVQADLMLNVLPNTPSSAVAHAASEAEWAGGQKTSVVCLGLSLTVGATAGIRDNNVTAVAGLQDLSVSVKWSTVGDMHPRTMQAVVRLLLRSVILPVLNFRLREGFPLPIIPAVALRNATVQYGASHLVVEADLEYTGGIFGMLGRRKDRMGAVAVKRGERDEEKKFRNSNLGAGNMRDEAAAANADEEIILSLDPASDSGGEGSKPRLGRQLFGIEDRRVAGSKIDKGIPGGGGKTVEEITGDETRGMKKKQQQQSVGELPEGLQAMRGGEAVELDIDLEEMQRQIIAGDAGDGESEEEQGLVLLVAVKEAEEEEEEGTEASGYGGGRAAWRR